MLVECHRHSLAASADGDARIDLTFLDSLGQRVGVVGIVTAQVAVATEVLIWILVFFQILDDELLQRIACVVAGNSYCLNFHKLFRFYEPLRSRRGSAGLRLNVYAKNAFTCLYTFSAVKPSFSSSTL